MHSYFVCEDEVSRTVTGAGELTVGRNLQGSAVAIASQAHHHHRQAEFEQRLRLRLRRAASLIEEHHDVTTY
ncbi:hypothetical protein E2C01_016890 [Portunus trituberculatus]|uniref:Uncharacterized protein n=1 Tax=Portunus trituberculatus TaxID=210409 RepID=A0A5B7DRF1_PORTR|nr:hypothetical protein [Portunus trituberculatus]